MGIIPSKGGNNWWSRFFVARLLANGEMPCTTDHGHGHGKMRRIMKKKLSSFCSSWEKKEHLIGKVVHRNGGPCQLCELFAYLKLVKRTNERDINNLNNIRLAFLIFWIYKLKKKKNQKPYSMRELELDTWRL